ncbi:Meckel syndrome type 1 protein-like isoform X2 [Amphibalanus amphitrite]|uniref:Meckel syndrome type 1 protein-like isoform X2 n=1 Tax=Amphibalanus amphitrite TaxID=1232801 RepID=UPI001C91AE87|nr:Meckel syndrome type 1 protein-like isoform X2 [Amphibalanus amphitrite]XP_043224892.1 Meckel syndrome type 1 protein-like isoform X2 [Amphibalanus amphitrite]XP_043224893.1 Meckel syndrome type 1 protein-like isoform X2 [Amphibalanus amphitrite]
MDFTEEFQDDGVGIYRCTDLSSTLAIKVTVSSQGSADPQTEEALVLWQQKIFSAAEVERYCSLETPGTELQRRLKEEALRLRAAAQPPTNAVFTHIHGEEFCAQHERSKQLTKPAVRPTKLAETLLELRHRTGLPHSEGEAEGADADQTGDAGEPAEPALSAVEQRLRSLALCSTETMFVMLRAQDEEHVLCRLDWSQSGVLTVRPDFSPGSLPYRLQVSEGQKGLYAYRLEWVPPPADEARAADLSASHAQTAQSRSRRDTGARPAPAPEFPLPPVGTLLVALNGELVSAGGFHGDNLFIQFFIELPKGWRAGADTRLSGITQLCRAPRGRDAHFGFPISAELTFTAPDDEEPAFQRWPTLYVEVLSEDALGMVRTEGYSHLSVPTTAGSVSRRLAAWRPIGSREAQLRRFFIGGSPELEDPSFVAVPTDFQGSRLSRYGFRTETTGEVSVRLSALHQSQSWAQRPAGQAAAAPGVGAVLEAFRRARLRMLRARQQFEESATEAAARGGGAAVSVG